MKNPKKHGSAPYKIVVVHGGPGAAREMFSLAKELSKIHGTLEPLQTKKSIAGQIAELKEIIKQNSAVPIILIGWSWGAWLSYIFTANYPSLVKKLIFIASGPFEESYTKEIMRTRLSRLSKEDKHKLQILNESLNNPDTKDKNELFINFGKFFDKTDSYSSSDAETESVEIRQDIYQSVWPEAAELRRSGKLLKLGEKISCPVVAIHGDYDPHPTNGVKKPLSQVIKNFKFILIKNCGHKPWIEQTAKDKFYELLKKELS